MSTMAIQRDTFFMGAEKEEFLRRIINDDQLAKCLASNEQNYLDLVLTDDIRYSLPYSRIFPCMFTVDTQKETGSFITMRFEYRPGQKPNIWKVARVTFYVFCHKNLIRTDYGVLRTDFMLNRLNAIMNDSEHPSWYTRLQFSGMDDTVIDDVGTYVGSAITYSAPEKWIS